MFLPSKTTICNFKDAVWSVNYGKNLVFSFLFRPEQQNFDLLKGQLSPQKGGFCKANSY